MMAPPRSPTPPVCRPRVASSSGLGPQVAVSRPKRRGTPLARRRACDGTPASEGVCSAPPQGPRSSTVCEPWRRSAGSTRPPRRSFRQPIRPPSDPHRPSEQDAGVGELAGGGRGDQAPHIVSFGFADDYGIFLLHNGTSVPAVSFFNQIRRIGVSGWAALVSALTRRFLLT